MQSLLLVLSHPSMLRLVAEAGWHAMYAEHGVTTAQPALLVLTAAYADSAVLAGAAMYAVHAAPAVPDVHALHAVPAVHAVPAEPAVPAESDVPAVQLEPGVHALPAEPAVPDAIAKPAVLGRVAGLCTDHWACSDQPVSPGVPFLMVHSLLGQSCGVWALESQGAVLGECAWRPVAAPHLLQLALAKPPEQP